MVTSSDSVAASLSAAVTPRSGGLLSSDDVNGKSEKASLNIVRSQMSRLITKGMKKIRLYKKKLQRSSTGSVGRRIYGADSDSTGQNALSAEFGGALFSFTHALKLASTTLSKSANVKGFSSIVGIDYVVARNNIAALYLEMAGSLVSGPGLDRDAVQASLKMVEEAYQLLGQISTSEKEEKELIDEDAAAADWEECMRAAAKNMQIVHRMRAQLNDEFIELRGSVPRSAVDAVGAVVAEGAETVVGAEGAEEPSSPPPPPRVPNFPPIERLRWPPSYDHLEKYGFKHVPTVGAYVRRRNTPVILEGTNDGDVDAWRLQKKWSNTTYLEENLNPIVMASMTERPSNLYGTDLMNSRMNIGEFFSRLKQMNRTSGEPHDGKYPYISIDIDEEHIPAGGALKDDLVSINFNEISAGYFPIAKKPMKLILWVGASNVSAVGHYDHAFNCFLMIAGSKRFVVAPPGSSIDLYFHPAPSHSHRQSQMRSYDNFDGNKFPRAVHVPFQEGEVFPGEIMYLPPFWTHQVESTTGPSIALSAWSYPGKVLQCVEELSNNWRQPVARLLSQTLKLAESTGGTLPVRLHLGAYLSFIVRVLTKVFDEGDNSKVQIGDGSSVAFLRALLESKYNNKDSAEAGCTAVAECPDLEDMMMIPPMLDRAIEEEAVRRAIMMGSKGNDMSPLNNLLDVGAHVPLMMASVEYLSHVGLSYGRTINHGDEAGTKVCHFLTFCVLPMLDLDHMNGVV